MCYAFIYPYFTYCITVWGKTFSYIFDLLMKLQKRALHLVDGAGKYGYTAPIFEKYELLNLENLCIYRAHIFLYKHHQKILPEVFSNFFEMNNVGKPVCAYAKPAAPKPALCRPETCRSKTGFVPSLNMPQQNRLYAYAKSAAPKLALCHP